MVGNNTEYEFFINECIDKQTEETNSMNHSMRRTRKERTDKKIKTARDLDTTQKIEVKNKLLSKIGTTLKKKSTNTQRELPKYSKSIKYKPKVASDSGMFFLILVDFFSIMLQLLQKSARFELNIICSRNL